jgi:hypothetical protein
VLSSGTISSSWFDARVIRRGMTGLVVGFVAIVVAGCSTGSNPSTAPTQPQFTQASPCVTASATGTVAFCVGVFPPLNTRPGDSVIVRIDTASGVLSPSTGVGTRVTVQVSPGPFKIVVKGHTQLAGLVTVGSNQAGSVGAGCPP